MLEFLSLFLLVYLQRNKSASVHSRSSTTALDSSPTRRISSGDLQTLEQETPLLVDVVHDHGRYSSGDGRSPSHSRLSREISKSEVRRGKIMSFLSATVIVVAWILFMTTAWMKLGKQKGAH